MRLAVLTGFACTVLSGSACGDNRPLVVPAAELWNLSADRPAREIGSGEIRTLVFVLARQDGVAVPGERIEFAAMPEGMVAGATLSAPAALTDSRGMATVSLRAGLPTNFEISAKNPRAAIAKVAVTVVDKMTAATLFLVPGFEPGFAPPAPVVAIELLRFEDRTCGGLSRSRPAPEFLVASNLVLGEPTRVLVDRTRQTALLARANDAAGTVGAAGCIDIAAGAVLPGANPRVSLSLSALELTPASTYEMSTHIFLAKRNLSARISAPWLDLTDCPLDPSQLWLDCAIDALASSPADPLDCVPASMEDEGALADAIGARRGPNATGSACRPARLPDDSASLDAKLAALFPNPAQSPAMDLDTLVGFAEHVLDDFSVASTLSLEATGTAGTLRGTHTLQSATFLIGSQPVRSDVLALGVPESQARFVNVAVTGAELTVAQHGLGLRIGTLARLAFEEAVSLRPGGLARGIGPVLTALFDLASTRPGPERKTGCDALDEIVCADISRPAGCLRDACRLGQAALIARNTAGFESANGVGADLQWGGTIDMHDDDHDDDDGLAERLGPGPMEKWTVQFRSAGPTETTNAEVSGEAR